MPAVRSRPKPKAKRRAQIAESNARRDQRLGAVRALYSFAEEISLLGHRVNAKGARNGDVERLVRLLEARLSNTDGMRDSMVIQRGFKGDSKGIQWGFKVYFGDSTFLTVWFFHMFGGDSSVTTYPYYNIKRKQWGCGLPSVLQRRRLDLESYQAFYFRCRLHE